jgi:hypothetical protein
MSFIVICGKRVKIKVYNIDRKRNRKDIKGVGTVDLEFPNGVYGDVII